MKLFALAVLGVSWVVTAAPAPAVAAECPNEAIRVVQSSTRLPDCRAYERVSPEVKNASDIKGPGEAVGLDGEGLTYSTTGVFPGSPSGTLTTQYRSERTASGWGTIGISPPTVRRNPVTGDDPVLLAGSPDLTRTLFETQYPVDPEDQGVGPRNVTSSIDLYRRNEDGSFTWISRRAALPDTSGIPVYFVAASPDLSRVLMITKRALDASVPGETENHLYLHVDGRPTRIVDVDPAGNPVALDISSKSMSSDGSRVAFVAGTAGSRVLYLRVNADDPVRAATIRLGAGTEGRTCGDATLVALSPDGSTVLFGCANQLTDEAIPAGANRGLYLLDVDSGELRLLGGAGSEFATVYGGSPDFSEAFISGLGGGSYDAGDLILYLHDGELVSAASAAPGLNSKEVFETWMSANGRYLAFTTRAQIGFPNNDLRQVYRYDAETADLDCVSCPTDGSPAVAEATMSPTGSSRYTGGRNRSPVGGVSTTGEVFFNTVAPLVPADQNEAEDVYAWRDGEPRLISSGRDMQGAAFVSASADGRDLFFVTIESLLAEDTDGRVGDVYDARVGGGFESEPDPIPCSGEACQGAVAPVPAPGAVGSAGFSGAGDQAPPTPSPGVSLASHRSGEDVAARLRVKVPAAGRITLAGGAVRSLGRKVGAGASTLPVRLKGPAKRALRKRGRLTVKVRVGFAPTAGAGRSARRVKLGFSRSRSGRVTVRLIRSGK
jgi:hypothetical protein